MINSCTAMYMRQYWQAIASRPISNDVLPMPTSARAFLIVGEKQVVMHTRDGRGGNEGSALSKLEWWGSAGVHCVDEGPDAGEEEVLAARVSLHLGFKKESCRTARLGAAAELAGSAA